MNSESIWFLLLLLFLFAANGAMVESQNTSNSSSSRPSVINIGALFTYNSTIGRSAKLGIDLAIQDVNANSSILAGTKLNIIMQDTNCSGFLGNIEALEMLEKDVIAIIGPQSSTIAHVISQVVNELHVPLISFGATDPTLAPMEFPYFIRTTHSDSFQMKAVADIVYYYGWREVTAIYVDDDYGRGAITALGDELELKRSKISYKAAFPANADSDMIKDLLVTVNSMESRIFVVHVNPDTGKNIFSYAESLGMLGTGYVWIATDWLASYLDSSADPDVLSLMQGVIVLRHHTADSDSKRRFIAQWNASFHMNTYALYAYDSVWLVAQAIDQFLNSDSNISFSTDPKLRNLNSSALHLGILEVFNRGQELLQLMLLTTFNGLTGKVQFDSDRNLVNPAYEIINIVGTSLRSIGYWSNYSGLSVAVPEILYSKPPNASTTIGQKLSDVLWPGETTVQPRGWVFPNNGQPLRIGVPNKLSFKEFITNSSGSDGVSGFCIDVFNAAVKLLPYPVPCSFILIGDGLKNPNYDDIISMVAQNVLDAAVGDFAIVRNRTKIADFTQPYTESGLVIVAPVQESGSSPWAFLEPFSFEMWCVTGVFFLFVGAVVWVLEHRVNPEFRGSPGQQLVTICSFSFSTMFFSHRENTLSTLGRFVLIIWLFVVLIINSSYTASLTSILTVQQLSSGITGLDGLLASSDPIGYQAGKFSRNYMIDELGIRASRLVPLNSPQEYARALDLGPKGGGVAVIVDEIPYIKIFLSTYCNYRIIGQPFTKNGWGFAFQRDSPLAVDMSTAILTLSEDGDLQRIHDKWLSESECIQQDTEISASRLSLRSFWGLFLICGVVCFLSLAIFSMRLCCQYIKFQTIEEGKPAELPVSEVRPTPIRRLSSFKDVMQFVDRKEEEINRSIKRNTIDKPRLSSFKDVMQFVDRKEEEINRAIKRNTIDKPAELPVSEVQPTSIRKLSSFKDAMQFADRKEEEINRAIKRNTIDRQTSQVSDTNHLLRNSDLSVSVVYEKEEDL